MNNLFTCTLFLTTQQKAGIQSTISRAFPALSHQSWNCPRLWPPSSGRAAETQPGKSCSWPLNFLFFLCKGDHLHLQSTVISWKIPVFQKPAAFSADSLRVCESMNCKIWMLYGKGEVNLTDFMKRENLDFCKWRMMKAGLPQIGKEGRWVWGFLHTHHFLASLQILCGRLITSLTSACLPPI